MTRPQLDPGFVRAFRRERLMAAAASACAGRYHDAIVAEIVKRAGVARNTFYEVAKSKEDVVRQAIAWIVDEALERVETAAGATVGIDGRIEAGLGALLEFVDEHPDRAQLVLVDGPAAAPDLYEYSLERFAKLLGHLNPDQPGGDVVRQMLVGGVAHILYQQICREQERDRDALLAELTDFIAEPAHAEPVGI